MSEMKTARDFYTAATKIKKECDASDDYSDICTDFYFQQKSIELLHKNAPMTLHLTLRFDAAFLAYRCGEYKKAAIDYIHECFCYDPGLDVRMTLASLDRRILGAWKKSISNHKGPLDERNT